MTAIQRADEDGNPATEAEPTWMTEHPTTPPYPAYASNASAIGTASATVLAEVFGPNVSFQVNWPQGPRPYASFRAAADEMANSRIYGGIHFRFDCVAGQEIGVNVGEYVVDNYLSPSDDDGQDDDEGVSSFGKSGRGIVASPLFLGRELFSHGPVSWATPGDQGKQGRSDLHTKLVPKIGHLLDHDHRAARVMEEMLVASTRPRATRGTDADEVFAAIDDDGEMPWLGNRGRMKR